MPPLPFQTSSFPPSEHSLERTTAPSFLLSLEQGIWKTGPASTPLHHIQSSQCLFSSLLFPPSLHILPLYTCYISAYPSPASFHFYCISLHLFSSPPSWCLFFLHSPSASECFVLDSAVKYVMNGDWGNKTMCIFHSRLYLYHTWHGKAWSYTMCIYLHKVEKLNYSSHLIISCTDLWAFSHWIFFFLQECREVYM